MIKFKVLYYVLVLLMALCLFSLIAMVLGLFAMHYKSTINQEWITVITIAFAKVLLLVISLSFIKRSIGMFLHYGYFNTKSANYLTIAGYTMAGSALVTFIFNLTEITYVDQESASDYILEMIHDITILLIGFALLGVSDIIKKGVTIKLENDLTI